MAGQEIESKAGVCKSDVSLQRFRRLHSSPYSWASFSISPVTSKTSIRDYFGNGSLNCRFPAFSRQTSNNRFSTSSVSKLSIVYINEHFKTRCISGVSTQSSNVHKLSKCCLTSTGTVAY